MWLLRTGDLINGHGNIELVQFWGNKVQPYAILSHRWSSIPDEEVSFADVNYLSRSVYLADNDYDRQAILNKPGYGKLIRAMKKAHDDGLQYIWIDTCCIDKHSSVELSEAINSMYRYYENARKCYAYLADVPEKLQGFEDSEYFHRGWTLQELLAPTDLIFTDADWNYIGTRTTLCDAVSRCTGIAKDYLLKQTPVHHASIAERMSWAADRQLSREEDVAYSLLGIFNVNMYQLYGEGGQRAFQRLQEEILKQSEDQSIFAWSKPSSSQQPMTTERTFDKSEYHGLLADGPEDFKNCGKIRSYAAMPDMVPPIMTAKGLRLSLPMTPKTDKIIVAALHCPGAGTHEEGFLALYLLKLGDKPNSYVRVCCSTNLWTSEPGRLQELYVVQNQDYSPRHVIYPYHYLKIKKLKKLDFEDKLAYSMTRSPRMDHITSLSHVQHYKISKQAGQLVAAFLVQPKGIESVVKDSFEIVFGTAKGSELSWGFPDKPNDECHLVTRQSGSTVVLPLYEVTVWIEEQVIGNAKWFSATVGFRLRPDELHKLLDENKKKEKGTFFDKSKDFMMTGIRRIVPQSGGR